MIVIWSESFFYSVQEFVTPVVEELKIFRGEMTLTLWLFLLVHTTYYYFKSIIVFDEIL
jgi:hypothetical protein